LECRIFLQIFPTLHLPKNRSSYQLEHCEHHNFLQLNGIGPAALLEQFGILLNSNNDGVGANLSTHQVVSLGFLTASPVNHNYTNTARTVAEAFINSNPLSPGAAPDLQLDIVEGVYPEYFDETITGPPKGLSATAVPTPPYSFIGFVISSLQPVTLGSVNIQSTDSFVQPLIDYGWGSNFNEGDVGKLISGMTQVRDLMDILIANHVILSEVWPSTTYSSLLSELFPNWAYIPPVDQQQIADVYHVKYDIHHEYHIFGTCSMGASAPSCVDTHGRVRGVSGLSVCDNSILPIPPDGNPTATLLAVCAKIADWHVANVDEYVGVLPSAS